LTVIRVDPAVLQTHASRIEAHAQSLRSAGRDASRATQGAPSYDGQFGPKVAGVGTEALARILAIADRLDSLAVWLRGKAEEFAAADQLAQAGLIGPGPWINWEELPWWLELVIGMVPGGDLLDISKELDHLIEGQDVDKLVLLLAILGLVADLGYLEPTPAGEAGNAGLASLKIIFKAIPAGPLRDEVVDLLVRAARDETLRRQVVAIGEQIAHHPELIDVLRRNPEALSVLLKNGPEAVETVARFGEDGVELVSKYGDDGLEALRRYGDDLPPEDIGRLLRFANSGGEITEDVLKTFSGPLVGGDVPAAFTDRAVITLGRLPDTTAAKEAGETILEFTSKPWSMEENFLQLNEAIQKGDVIHLASPVDDVSLSHPYYDLSVYTRELDLLMQAGYKRVGDYLVPPH
jgi:hypothetical protein